MRAPIIEWDGLDTLIIAELADDGGMPEATRPAQRPSRKKLASTEPGSHIDGLEVSESTWSDWDQAYEECTAQALRDRLLDKTLHLVPR